MFGISITNPSLLYYAALAALPVLIHLFFRRRFKVHKWAAMEFLKVSNIKSRSIKKVENLLLLIMRCLVIVLFVAAFSRPLVKAPSQKGGSGRTAAYSVIILDNSYSMGLKDGNSTVFESAKKRALEISGLLEEGSAVSLITAGWKAKPVIKEPTYQLNVAKKELENTALSDSSTDYPGALQAALELLKNSGESIKEVYLVTDCQQRAFTAGEKELKGVLKELSAFSNIYLVDVSAANRDNIALTSIKFSKDVVDKSFPVRIQGEVSNFTGRNQQSIIVDLIMDGRNLESRSVSVAPGKTAQVSFSRKFLESGIHSGYLRIPEDLLNADNKAYFALKVEDRLKVLIVDGDPGRKPFQNESDFLNCAFMPFRGGDSDESPFKAEVTTLKKLQAADLSTYKAVILSNVPSLPAGDAGRIEDYVKKGGGLIIFAGDAVDAVSYNSALFRDRSGFLPCRIGEVYEEPGKNGLRIESAGIAAGSCFEALTRKELSRARSTRCRKLEVDADDPLVTVMASFSNGLPAAVARVCGKGTSVIMPFDASNKWSDMALKPVFLPFLYELVYFTASGSQDRGKMILTGNAITKMVPFNEAMYSVSVRSPSGRSYGVNPAMTNEGKLIRFAGTDEAGVYELMIGQTLDHFAVNLESEESDLKKASKEYIYGISPEKNFTFVEANDDLKGLVSERRKGQGIWKQIIFAMLLIMLTESALAAKFGKRDV